MDFGKDEIDVQERGDEDADGRDSGVDDLSLAIGEQLDHGEKVDENHVEQEERWVPKRCSFADSSDQGRGTHSATPSEARHQAAKREGRTSAREEIPPPNLGGERAAEGVQ